MIRTIASTADFDETLTLFTDRLGFRLEMISPADDPVRAIVSRQGVVVEINPTAAPDETAADMVVGRDMTVPDTEHELSVSTGDDESWGTGRAGMRYRDLIPGRMGGRFIASNIEVCEGGPVPDLVHHHAVRFQVIVCQSGWVDVVYEHQGPPFRLHGGDAVLQPPHIRHRVLASSPGARVVEIGCPAEHDTMFDHDLGLPDAVVDPDRVWHGQRFVRHVGAEAEWIASRSPGFECQVSTIAAATAGLADLRIHRPSQATTFVDSSQDGEFQFIFVLTGTATLELAGTSVHLGEGGSANIPPRSPWALRDASPALRLLEVALPAPPT